MARAICIWGAYLLNAGCVIRTDTMAGTEARRLHWRAKTAGQPVLSTQEHRLAPTPSAANAYSDFSGSNVGAGKTTAPPFHQAMKEISVAKTCCGGLPESMSGGGSDRVWGATYMWWQMLMAS